MSFHARFRASSSKIAELWQLVQKRMTLYIYIYYILIYLNKSYVNVASFWVSIVSFG